MKIFRKFMFAFLCLFLIISNSSTVFAKDVSVKREKNDTENVLNRDIIDLYKNSIDSLSSRMTERGYAQTSLTGTYQGMFSRDSSIQALMYTMRNDFGNAQKILNYLLSYNQAIGINYMGHILDNYQDLEYGNSFLGYDPSNTKDSFYKQDINNRLLFMIKHDTNKAAQPFSAPFNEITSVKAMINNKVDNDRLRIKIMRDYTDEDTIVYQEDFVLEGSQSDDQCVFREFVFEKPVQIFPNALYYLVIEQPEENGYIAWGGIDQSGEFEAINYDHGWANSGSRNITGFEIVGKEVEVAKDTYFIGQPVSDNALFLLNTPNNKAAQPFMATGEKMNKINVNITNENAGENLVLKIMEDYQDENSIVYTDTITLDQSYNFEWVSFEIDDDIRLSPSQQYYLVLESPNSKGKVIWNGKRDASAYNAINYDLNANGGWKVDSTITGFEILHDTNIKNNKIVQKVQFDKTGSLAYIDVNLNAKSSVNVRINIKESLDGKILSTASSTTQKNQEKLRFDFQNVSIEENKDYYLEFIADEDVDLIPNDKALTTDAPSYRYVDGQWVQSTLNYTADYYIQSEMVTSFGGKNIAKQEIPVIDGEYITAVEVELMNSGQKNPVTILAKLYKKSSDGLIFVSEDEEQLTSDPKIRFNFGMSLEKVNPNDNYVIELSAVDADDDQIWWLGSKEIDDYETLKNNEQVTGEASFIAYRSDIHTLSSEKQVDGNYSVILSWCRFVEAVSKLDNYDTEYKDWVDKTYPIIANLANYYLVDTDQYQSEGFYTEWNLMFNPSIEHTRREVYHEGYDLMTNVFISQALHELSLIGSMYDDENVAKWQQYDKAIVSGIKDHFIRTINGKDVYIEMIGWTKGDKANYKDIVGYSWINIAPIAVDWYAMDEEVMKNTFEEYQRLGVVDIDEEGDFNDYHVLDSCTFVTDDGMELLVNSGLDGGRWDSGFTGYVIGKGLAWEMVYNYEEGNIDRVEELIDFQMNHRTQENKYIEFWWWNDYRGEKHRYTDPGNQEHASWQAYAMSRIFPTLRMGELDYNAYNTLIKQFESLDKSAYTVDTYENLAKIIAESKEVLKEDDLLQAEIDIEVNNIQKGFEGLEKLPIEAVNKDALKEAVAEAEKLDVNNYTASSKEMFVTALNTAKDVLGNEEATQKEVDTALENLKNAIASLEYKEADYSKVEEAINKANSLDKNLYKDFSKVEEAIDKVVKDLDITKQAEVDAMAKAINDAVNALEYKDADYSKVDEIISAIPKDLDKYTEESVKALNNALNAIVRDLDITHQEEVDEMAANLLEAIKELKIKDKQPTIPEDKPEKPGTPEKEEENKNDVQTGVQANTGLYAIGLLIAAAGAGYIISRRKRNKYME